MHAQHCWLAGHSWPVVGRGRGLAKPSIAAAAGQGVGVGVAITGKQIPSLTRPLMIRADLYKPMWQARVSEQRIGKGDSSFSGVRP